MVQVENLNYTALHSDLQTTKKVVGESFCSSLPGL